MQTITLNAKLWAGMMAKLGKSFIPAAKRGAKLAAARSVALLQRSTGELGVVNTGNFKRKWRWSAMPDGARVYNLALYSAVLEYGRRSNSRFPPKEAIARWAQRKLGLSRKAALQAAFPIARAIAKRGLKPRRVLQSNVGEMYRILIEEVTRQTALVLVGRSAP